jgi:hypothetical protein
MLDEKHELAAALIPQEKAHLFHTQTSPRGTLNPAGTLERVTNFRKPRNIPAIPSKEALHPHEPQNHNKARIPLAASRKSRRTCQHSRSQAPAAAPKKIPQNQANAKRASSQPPHQSTGREEETRRGGKARPCGLRAGRTAEPETLSCRAAPPAPLPPPPAAAAVLLQKLARATSLAPLSPEPPTTSAALSTPSENTLSPPEAFLSFSTLLRFSLFFFCDSVETTMDEERGGEGGCVRPYRSVASKTLEPPPCCCWAGRDRGGVLWGSCRRLMSGGDGTDGVTRRRLRTGDLVT